MGKTFKDRHETRRDQKEDFRTTNRRNAKNVAKVEKKIAKKEYESR